MSDLEILPAWAGKRGTDGPPPGDLPTGPRPDDGSMDSAVAPTPDGVDDPAAWPPPAPPALPAPPASDREVAVADEEAAAPPLPHPPRPLPDDAASPGDIGHLSRWEAPEPAPAPPEPEPQSERRPGAELADPEPGLDPAPWAALPDPEPTSEPARTEPLHPQPATSEPARLTPPHPQPAASEPPPSPLDSPFLDRAAEGGSGAPPPVPEIRPRPEPSTPAAGSAEPAPARRPVAVDRPGRPSGLRLFVKTLLIFLVVGAIAAALGYLAGRLVTEDRTSAEAGSSATTGDPVDESTTSASVTAPASTALDLALGQQGLTVTGTVPDQTTATAIEEAVEITFAGAGSVEVEIDPSLPAPAWLEALPPVIHGFGSLIEGTLVVEGEAAELRAVAPDSRALRRVTDALDAGLGFPPLTADATSITTERAASLTATADGGVLTLTGTVPSTVVRDEIVSRGAEIYDEIDVADEIEVDPAAYLTQEWRHFPDALSVFAALGDFEIGIDGTTFHGQADDGFSFSRDDTELDDGSVTALEELSAIIIRSGRPVTVVGYASDADDEEAVELALARAEEVAGILLANGVDESQVTTTDAGDDIDDGRRAVVVIGTSS